MSKFNIRPAKENETDVILEFIQKMADYEKLSHEVSCTSQVLHESLFVNHDAEVVFAEEDDQIVGFALFFHNFSTFVGKKGLYLEDIFVIPEKRGLGYGKSLFLYLEKLAVERGCGRMEWVCLDWNVPSINFYKSLGAVPMEDWTVYRLTSDKLKDIVR